MPTKQPCEHKWITRYITIDSVDTASGMECQHCEKIIHQDEIEMIVNIQNMQLYLFKMLLQIDQILGS
jgi:hypothetical protein